MLKRIFLILIILVAGIIARAQTADEVYSTYLDFNLARLQGESDKALEIGERILPDTIKLPVKARTNFYNSIAKLYEDNSQDANAIRYYQRVVATEPNYYVAHRALGYLYVKEYAGKPVSEMKIDSTYFANVNKALPYLEKAQACDPDEDTLNLIKLLYRNIKDQRRLNTLPARLSALSKNCEDILSDQ